MSKEEMMQRLLLMGFKKERNSEYNNEVYENVAYPFENSLLHLEVFVDYYNVRMVWWYQKGRKVAKNYYVNKDLTDYKTAEELISSFISLMIKTYRISL